MGADFFIIIAVLLRVTNGGQESWEQQGAVSHHMAFQSLEVCEKYRDDHGQEIAEFVGKRALIWWADELDVGSEALRLTVEFSCFDDLS